MSRLLQTHLFSLLHGGGRSFYDHALDHDHGSYGLRDGRDVHDGHVRDGNHGRDDGVLRLHRRRVRVHVHLHHDRGCTSHEQVHAYDLHLNAIFSSR